MPTAIALFLGIIIGSLLPPLVVKAQDNVLYASKIIMPDDGLVFETPEGNEVIKIRGNDYGGCFSILNNYELSVVSIEAGEYGGGIDIGNNIGTRGIGLHGLENGGNLIVSNKHGKPVILLVPLEDEVHFYMFNNSGTTAVAFEASEGGGSMGVFNEEGHCVAGLDVIHPKSTPELRQVFNECGSGRLFIQNNERQPTVVLSDIKYGGIASLYNKEGLVIVSLGANLLGSGNGDLNISNAEGHIIAGLGATTADDSGSLTISNAEGQLIVRLGGLEGNGNLNLCNDKGKLAVGLGAGDEGGILSLLNYYAGEPVVGLGTSKSRGYISVWNTDGEPVWGSP